MADPEKPSPEDVKSAEAGRTGKAAPRRRRAQAGRMKAGQRLGPRDIAPPDPADTEKFAAWLATKDRSWSVVIAARAALRVLPLIGHSRGSGRGEQVLSAFRAAAISRFAVVYPNSEMGVAAAAAANDADYAAARAQLDIDDYGSTRATRACAVAYTTTYTAAYSVAYIDSADRVAYAAAEAELLGLVAAIRIDAVRLEGGVSPAELARELLWLEANTKLPRWAKTARQELSDTLVRLGDHWHVWADWYADVVAGRPHADAWEKAFVDLDPDDPLPWDDGPKAVNERIAARLAKLEKSKVTPGDEEPSVLTQRPSSHRFDWRGDRLEALAVVESPFDPLLAETLATELREKGRDLLAALVKNNADEIVQRAVERALALLDVSVAEVAEGLLLSRFNTLSAHARAYADPNSERERAIRAVLDDFATSLGSLVDCYPGIRTINANRLALAMQAEQAPEVEAELRHLSVLAQGKTVVGDSTRAALDAGRDEVDDLSTKIERETDLVLTADWIKARGEAVAARLSDGTNFMSAVLTKAGTELGGLSADTWKEIRKTLPNATARGIAKGTEKALEEGLSTLGKMPAVALAYCIAGPLGALAVLVPRLGAHKKKADEIKAQVEKPIEPND